MVKTTFQSAAYLNLKRSNNDLIPDSEISLAQSITRQASKQTYYIARFMVDKALVDDFFRAYAYFRWIDDVIDESHLSPDNRISFIKRQRKLLSSLYENEKSLELSVPEQIIETLINHDQQENSKLRSFIWNMFAIVEFDAYRKNQLITGEQLEWYSNCLARSVTDGLQYFIGNHHTYPSTSHQYLAAKAAHLTHQLRDMVDDLSNGFINIPKEYLAVNSIDRIQMDHPALRSWVKDRVEFARMYFREGKQYLDNLKVVRCKLVGRWYCARFEKILDKIVHDDYLLRKVYNKGRGGSSQLKMSWLAFTRPFRHQNRF